jgi:hypothetical protein
LEDENKGNHDVVVSPYCKHLFNELKAEIDKLQDSIYDMNHADKTQNIAIDIIHKLSAICDTTFKFETANKTPQLISSLNSTIDGFELYIRPSNAPKKSQLGGNEAPASAEKEFDDTIRKYNNNRGC